MLLGTRGVGHIALTNTKSQLKVHELMLTAMLTSSCRVLQMYVVLINWDKPV